ncbi:DUF72 domain-containing protein [Chitinophaga niabensis]|uniref:DUF72 domain-containing protein n=1 Tax=Chitinophaga niabensis TaxID=536979 RepID=UPI0031BBB1FB
MHLHIGTSGWSYKEWKGLYYPEKLKSVQWLYFYSRELFKCVEINSSFYHLPKAQTVLNWALAVPDDFRFCPKMSRYVSHYQKLHDAADSLRLFFTIFDPIKDKLGPILIQLPAQVTFNREVAAPFFDLLVSVYREYSFALEVRHESWLQPQSVELLQQYDISLVIAQSAMPFPYHELITAHDVYLRFHGPGKLYASRYDDATMLSYAKKCAHWMSEGHSIWVFFNNTFHGDAIENARLLERYILECLQE